MPRPMTEQERQVLLAEPRFGVLNVGSSDGRPKLTVPIWYAYQPGGDITFFTGTFGRKARKTALIQKAGAVSLAVQHGEASYRYVTVEGSVLEPSGPDFVHFTIRPDRWITSDFSEDDG